MECPLATHTASSCGSLSTTRAPSPRTSGRRRIPQLRLSPSRACASACKARGASQPPGCQWQLCGPSEWGASECIGFTGEDVYPSPLSDCLRRAVPGCGIQVASPRAPPRGPARGRVPVEKSAQSSVAVSPAGRAPALQCCEAPAGRRGTRGAGGRQTRCLQLDCTGTAGRRCISVL